MFSRLRIWGDGASPVFVFGSIFVFNNENQQRTTTEATTKQKTTNKTADKAEDVQGVSSPQQVGLFGSGSVLVSVSVRAVSVPVRYLFRRMRVRIHNAGRRMRDRPARPALWIPPRPLPRRGLSPSEWGGPRADAPRHPPFIAEGNVSRYLFRTKLFDSRESF